MDVFNKTDRYIPARLRSFRVKIACYNMTFRRYVETIIKCRFKSFSSGITVLGLKKESAKSSSNKCTKTFYRDYLHCIGNFCATVLGRVRLGSTRNKNNWNKARKRLFGSYSHSGIPGFPFRLFFSQEQNCRKS